MSTQPSPQLSLDAPTPFDTASEVLAPGVREACAPPAGVGLLGPGQRLANMSLIERLQGDVQWLRHAFQVCWQPCRRGRRAWVVTAPARGFGKTHFFNALAQRLDGDAVVVAIGPSLASGQAPYWERAALGALVQALDRAEAGGALTPATPAGDRSTTPALESHWTALARSVLAGAVRELLVATADRAGDGRPSPQRLQQAAEQLPPDLQRTADWQGLLDHVLGKPTLLDAAIGALRARGIATQASLRTWLNVFHTLLFADDLELRAACRRWIGGRPVASDLCDQMGVDECDRLAVEGDGEIARQQALARIADLSHFAAFYVPFVLCVEHHELSAYGTAVDATGRARRPLPREQDPVADLLEAMAPSLAHALLVVAMDEPTYTHCAGRWPTHLQSRCRPPVPLQGLGVEDARRLVDARLRGAAIAETVSQAVVGDGAWVSDLLPSEEKRLSPREFLAHCATRYRAQWEGESKEEGEVPQEAAPVSEEKEEPPALASEPEETVEAAWDAARAAVGAPSPVRVHDALVPLLRGLGEIVFEDVTVLAGDPPLTQLSWQFAEIRYGLAVGIADTRQRWGQLARRALLGERAVTVCLRLPGEMVVPNPAWPVAASMLERAISAGRLRVVHIPQEQCIAVATAAALLAQLEANADDPSRRQEAWSLIGRRLRWLRDLVLAPAQERPREPSAKD